MISLYIIHACNYKSSHIEVNEVEVVSSNISAPSRSDTHSQVVSCFV